MFQKHDIYRKALFYLKNESSFYHINPEISAKLFNLIYYLNPYPNPNPNSNTSAYPQP